jgi:hypothetical protein
MAGQSNHSHCGNVLLAKGRLRATEQRRREEAVTYSRACT